MMVAPFSPRMLTDVQQVMWQAWCSGLEMDVSGDLVGLCRKSVFNRVAEAGGIRPRRGRDLQGRPLSYPERMVIEAGRLQSKSLRAIAGQLGRAPSTVKREIDRNTVNGRITGPRPPRPGPSPRHHGRRPRRSDRTRS